MSNQQITEGQILASSWGYEQTNVDFYRVERIAGQFAVLQKLGSKETSDGELAMTGRAVPDEAVLVSARFRRKIHKASWGSTFVQITPYAYAYPWDGQPCRTSCYA